jgi:hypothetical protein
LIIIGIVGAPFMRRSPPQKIRRDHLEMPRFEMRHAVRQNSSSNVIWSEVRNENSADPAILIIGRLSVVAILRSA